jgi:uncharacterized protein
MKFIWYSALAVALIWIGVVAVFTASQRRLLYFPDPTRVPPESAGLAGVSEETVTTPDGITLITWWSPPKPGKPVIVYFQGNGGNMAVRAERVRLLQSTGAGVLMLGYRGYSGSGGTPSEAALIADGNLIIKRLIERGTPSKRIVAFGESLGTGIAVQMAAAHGLGGVILDSPYTSLPDVAATHYPFLPAHWFMWDQYNSLARIGQVRAPLLIVHGELDTVVPVALGQRLFEAANEPKRLVRLAGLGHVAPLKAGACHNTLLQKV